MNWSPRLAREDDIPALETLIPLSVHALQASDYSEKQRNAALGPVFGVDRQLVKDGTYYVVEHEGAIIGSGGWSKRESLFGSDRDRAGEDRALDPRHEPARIRAFFVHPDWARRGIGRSILITCEKAIQESNFRAIDLVATLAGEPLYAACGYSVVERYEIKISGGINLPGVKMRKYIGQ